MKIKEFIAVMPYIDEESREAVKRYKNPQRIGKYPTMANLDLITYGQLTELAQAKDDKTMIVESCRILLDMPQWKVMEQPCETVLGFVNMVRRESERIGKLFADLKTEPTKEERQAGSDKLNFGTFGVLDWYAQRMGIADHDSVLSVGWIRIYQAMKIDRETALYQRRLREIQYNNMKR